MFFTRLVLLCAFVVLTAFFGIMIQQSKHMLKQQHGCQKSDHSTALCNKNSEHVNPVLQGIHCSTALCNETAERAKLVLGNVSAYHTMRIADMQPAMAWLLGLHH